MYLELQRLDQAKPWHLLSQQVTDLLIGSLSLRKVKVLDSKQHILVHLGQEETYNLTVIFVHVKLWETDVRIAVWSFVRWPGYIFLSRNVLTLWYLVLTFLLRLIFFQKSFFLIVLYPYSCLLKLFKTECLYGISVKLIKEPLYN